MGQLRAFIDDWTTKYEQALQDIPMFAQEPPAWTRERLQTVVRAYAHSRTGFPEFLWYVASRAPSTAEKNVVLENIADEFGIGNGGNKTSHEQLYWRLAGAVGLNPETFIKEEVLGQHTNLPFLEEFNRGHLRWILFQPWDRVWSAFAAYERLDNPDADNMHRLFKHHGLSDPDLEFIEVHRRVAHYGEAEPLLESVWKRDADAVRAGFNFIGEHQNRMWRKIYRLALHQT